MYASGCSRTQRYTEWSGPTVASCCREEANPCERQFAIRCGADQSADHATPGDCDARASRPRLRSPSVDTRTGSADLPPQDSPAPPLVLFPASARRGGSSSVRRGDQTGARASPHTLRDSRPRGATPREHRGARTDFDSRWKAPRRLAGSCPDAPAGSGRVVHARQPLAARRATSIQRPRRSLTLGISSGRGAD